MIQLLFTLVFIEAAVVMTLVFGTPLRKVIIKGLDQFKRGRGSIVAKTVAGTMFVLFGSILFSAMKTQRRVSETGVINPTDEVLYANRILEASLMGFILFLAMITDRLHYYIRELQLARRNLELVTKETKRARR